MLLKKRLDPFWRCVVGDKHKTKSQLIGELVELRERIAEYKTLESELKQGEENLRRQTKHLESIIHYSSLAIVTLDEAHNVISCNREFEELFQFEESEITGKNLDEVVAGHQNLLEARSYTKETMDGKAIHGSGTRQRKDGSTVDVEFFGVPVVIDGSIVGAYGIYQDISERKRVEDALRESEKIYKELADSLPQPVFETDERGDLTFANRYAFDLFGYTRDEFEKGLNAFQMLAPEDRDSARENFARVLRGEHLGGVEYTAQRKDGSTFPIEIYSSPIVREHTVIGLRGIIVELTERKKTEEALRESEKKYSALVENSKDGIIMIQEGVLTFINEASTDLVGYSPEEMIGAIFVKFIAPDYRDLVVRRYSERMEGKDVPSIYEVELLRKDGTTVPVELNAMHIEFGGKPTDLAFVRDITERKHGEMEIQKRQVYLESVLHNAPEAIVTLDASNLVLEWNPGAEQIFGYTRQEVVGKNIDDLVALPEAYEEATVLTSKALSGRKIHPRETVRYRKDGTPIPVILAASPILIDNELHGVVVVYTDITERNLVEEALRESEERFRILVEESPFGVSIIGKDGRYKYLNPTFRAIFGYDLKDIPTGRQWFSKAYPDEEYRKEAIAAWINDLQGKDPGESRPKNFTVTCKDGSEKAIHFRPVTMKTGDQFVIYEDVTEIKQLEEQLHLAQRMEALGTLAGGIAHNFNNLLTGIMGNASLMLINTDPAHPYHERLKAVEKLVDSGSKLTRQLLGYARKGQYEVKPLNINHVVMETSDTFDATRKDIRVHRNLAEKLLGVHADQGQIEQILWNLYVNAADAMTDGGDLFIETHTLTHAEMKGKPYKVKPGTYVLITVRDTGSGMDKKTMERIFEPFFTTKGLARGTGLGLASVYGMVKAHSGYIDVDSRRGKGTTVSIYLPASQQEVPGSPPTAWRLERGQETLLLVDDEAMVLEVSQELLEMLGYTVIPARGGREALELYRVQRDEIDMVIIDLIMPDMGGGETYDQLRELNPQVKVLLSSGYSIDGQASEILKRGCDGFIQKPFEARELSQRIREILDKKKP
jgi:two-component system cell cycle sensor histidine kinase/response regulator CckA